MGHANMQSPGVNHATAPRLEVHQALGDGGKAASEVPAGGGVEAGAPAEVLAGGGVEAGAPAERVPDAAAAPIAALPAEAEPPAIERVVEVKRLRLTKKTVDDSMFAVARAMESREAAKPKKRKAAKVTAAAADAVVGDVGLAASAEAKTGPVCTWFDNRTRNLIVVKYGGGAGSTKSLSYGKATSTYKTFEEAEHAAGLLVAQSAGTGKKPW